MKRFLDILVLPAIGLVLALLGIYWLADKLGGGGRWLTLLVGCYAIMSLFPLLFWHATAGAWTVILVKGLGLGGRR